MNDDLPLKNQEQDGANETDQKNLYYRLKPFIPLLKAGIPALLLLFLTLVYISFDLNYVRCDREKNEKNEYKRIYGCEPLNANLISEVKNPPNLKTASREIQNVNANLQSIANNLTDKENQIKATQNSIADIALKTKEAMASNNNVSVNQLAKQKESSNANLTAQTAELTTLTNANTKAEKNLSDIRKNISARYSSRLIWVFLTAIFFVLCLTAILYSVYVIVEPWRNFSSLRLLWLVAVTIAAVSFFYYTLYVNDEYMSIMKPLLEQSINKFGDLEVHWVKFFNSLSFAADLFLLGASCSIFYKVETIKLSIRNNYTDGITIYGERIRMLLYIGSAMLFIGIFRMDIILDWHLDLVSFGQSEDYKTLLQSLFNNSLAVQAGFYAILLGVIYLPTAQSIPDSPDVKTTIDNKGWLAAIQEFAPRFLMLISPFIAQTLVTPLSTFFGNAQ